METHQARLTQIITGMAPAFAGPRRPRDQQIAEAVELVLLTKPTPQELADAREALLDRHQELFEEVHPADEAVRDQWLQERAAKAEALAIAEERVRHQ